MSDGVARHHRTSSTPTMQGVGDGAIAKLRAAAATKRASKTSEKSGIGEEGTGRHGADKSVTGVSKSKILGPPSHTRSKEVKGTVSHARKASPSLSKTRIAKVSLSEIKRKARRSRGVSLENRSNPANGSEGSIELAAFSAHGTSQSSLPQLSHESNTLNPAFARLSELNEEDHSKGVSVRSAMKILHIMQRNLLLRGCFIHFVFTGLFVGIWFFLHQSNVIYLQNYAIKDLFAYEEFNNQQGYNLNFFDIMTAEEAWTWLEGPFYRGVYSTTRENGMPKTEAERSSVVMYDRVIGKIRLRQLRVRDDSCVMIEPKLRTIDGLCFDEFARSGAVWFYGASEETRPWKGVGTNTTYEYTPDCCAKAVGAYGHEVDYGTGGYVVFFPNPRYANSSTVALKILSDLKSDDFIDRATRALIVDFNLYNPGTKLLTAARFVIQQFNSGAYQVACKLRTMRMSLYDFSSGSVRLRFGCEILFIFALLHRYYVWGHELWVHRLRMKDLVGLNFLFRDSSFVIDTACNILLLLILFAYGTFVVFSPARNTFDTNMDGYIDAWNFVQTYYLAMNLAAIMILVLVLMLFKYMVISEQMTLLFNTVMYAQGDLVALFVVLVLLSGGFALAGYFLFGHIDFDFHDIMTSTTTLLRFPLGDFNYDKMARGNPNTAPIFFICFIVVIFLLYLNVFIGVLSKYTDIAHTIAKEQEDGSIKAGLLNMAEVSYIVQRTISYYRNKIAPEGSQLYDYIGITKGEMSNVRAFEHETSVQKEMLEIYHKLKARDFAPIDLVKLFSDLYEENLHENVYISDSELANLLGDVAVAGEIIRLINYGKQLIVFKGEAHMDPFLLANSVHKFFVKKHARFGGYDKRVFILDAEEHTIRSMTLALKLQKVLPIDEISQIELDVFDSRTLTIVFFTGIRDYKVRFRSEDERGHFVDSLVHILLNEEVEAFDEVKQKRHSKSMSFHTAANLVKSVGALKKLATRRSQRGREHDAGDGGHNLRERSFKHTTRGSRGMGRVAELLRGGGHGEISPKTGGRRSGHHLSVRHSHRKWGSHDSEAGHDRVPSTGVSVSEETLVREEPTEAAQSEGDIEIQVP